MSKELPSPQEATLLLESIDSDIVQKAIEITRHISCRSIRPYIQRGGTGIQIRNGRVITASHIFDGLQTQSLYPYPGSPITIIDSQVRCGSGKVIYRSYNTDLAIVETVFEASKEVEVQPEKLEPYQTLLFTALPDPLHQPYAFRGLYLGDISDFNPNCKGRLRKAFLFYHSIDPAVKDSSVKNGFSGGGVFDTKGALVGMMTAVFNNGEPKGIAIKGVSIHSILHRYTSYPSYKERVAEEKAIEAFRGSHY